MLQMFLPVFSVLGRERNILNDQKILGIILLRRLGEIEGAGQNFMPVNHHDLVVGDGMFGVNICRDSGMATKSADEYFSVRWLLSKMTWIFTPRL